MPCAGKPSRRPASSADASRYFSSQPWPFPTSLMIGCHAEALSRDIVIDRAELDDARWFDREEVATMLLRSHPDGLDHAADRGDRLPHHPRLGGGRG